MVIGVAFFNLKYRTTFNTNKHHLDTTKSGNRERGLRISSLEYNPTISGMGILMSLIVKLGGIKITS